MLGTVLTGILCRSVFISVLVFIDFSFDPCDSFCHLSIFVLFQIPQRSQCTALSAFPQLQAEAADYICLANSDHLVKSYFYVLWLFPRVSGTRTSSLTRGAINPSSPTESLLPQCWAFQKTSVFSLSSSFLYLKTYKPYAEEPYESKYIYTVYRVPQIYV